MDVEINTQHVTGEQKQQLNIELCNLQKKIVVNEGSRAISHVTYPTTLTQFGKYQIEQVMEHCDKIFTIENVMDHIEIWNKKHALEIFKIINGVFQDTVEDINTDSDSNSDRSDNEIPPDYEFWDEIINDQTFLSLINTSEWNEEYFASSCYSEDADSLTDNTADAFDNYG